MSQSEKPDPNKTNKSKTGGEGSEPASGGPSADPTEEVVSAVKQFFGIGLDPSATDANKKGVSDSKNIVKNVVSEKSLTHQSPQGPTKTRDETESPKQPETSKALDTKAPQSPINSRSARDLISGRIITKTNSDRQTEPKQQGSERPSLDPTESMVSAVTSYFGIGQDEKPSQKKMSASVRNEQIVATSQQFVDNYDSSSDARRKASGSKVSDSKLPSTVTAKQKPSPETSAKGETVTSQSTINKNSQQLDDENVSEKRIPLQGSERPSKDPTESVVSAVTQYFGIGQQDSKPSLTKKTTSDQNEQIVNKIRNVEDKQTSENKIQDTKASATVVYGQKPSIESSKIDANIGQSSTRKQSQPAGVTENDGKDSRRLTETGEPSSKRVTIIPGVKATPSVSESVVSAVTDNFGISHSSHPSIIKTDGTPLATSSSQKQRSSIKDPIEGDDTKVKSKTNATSKPTGETQAVYAAKDEAARVVDSGKMTSRRVSESKISPSPDNIPTPIPVIVSPHDRNEKKPTSNTVQAESKSETPRVISDKQQADTNLTINANSKEPQPVATSNVETPRMKDDPKKPVTTMAADSKSPSGSDVQTPTIPLAVNSEGPQNSKVLPTTNVPQSVATSEAGSPRTAHDQRQPNTALTPDSKASSSPTALAPTFPVIVSGQDSRKSGVSDAASKPDKVKASAQSKESESKALGQTATPQNPKEVDSRKVSSNDSTGQPQPVPVSASGKPQIVDAGKNETPRTLNDQKAAAESSKTDSKVPAGQPTISSNDSTGQPQPVPVSASGKPQIVAAGKNETAQTLNDQRAAAESSKTDSKVPAGQATISSNDSTGQSQPVPVSVSGKPQTVAAGKIETPRTLNDQKVAESSKADSKASAGQATISSNDSTGQPQPVPVSASGKPQIVAADKNETPRTLNDQKVAESSKTDSNIPAGKGAIRSNDSTGQSQPVSVSASGKPQTTAAGKIETPRMANDGQVADSIKNDSNIPTGQATPSSYDSTGQPQPVPVSTSGKPQTVAASKIETPRTVDDGHVADSIKTDPNVPPSRPATVTNVPPQAINAQDAGKNKGRSSTAPENRRATDTSKEGVSKVPPNSTGVPQQSQPATADARETQRTVEGLRPIETTTTPAVASGTGVSTHPSPVVMNAQDRKGNNESRVTSTKVPPSSIQSTEPATGDTTTGSIAGTPAIRASHTSTATARQCWICFATDEDELGLPWIQPCRCRGTTKWVHQSCLQMWVDEKLREHKEKKVTCPQCRTEYLIYLPKANVLVRSLDQVDNVIYRVCPFVAAGVVIGSFYWNAVTYGAIVMLQVAGSEGASVVADTFSPTVIIVALPFIPLSLIVFRLFQWEDSFLYILRTTSSCVPLLNYILPGHVVNETGVVTDVPATAVMSFQRVLAGALLTPIIAKICGNLFFPSVTSPVWRTVFGGALFVSVKGLIKMYHKQQTYKRLSRRKILDYTDENKRLIEESPVMMNQAVPPPLRFQFIATVENRRNRRR